MFDQEISWNIKYLLTPFFQSIGNVGLERILYAEYELKSVVTSYDPYAQLAKALRSYQAAISRTNQEQKYVENLCKHYGQLLYLELPRFAKLLVNYGVLPQPHSPFIWLLRDDLVGVELSEEGEMLPCFQPKSN